MLAGLPRRRQRRGGVGRIRPPSEVSMPTVSSTSGFGRGSPDTGGGRIVAILGPIIVAIGAIPAFASSLGAGARIAPRFVQPGEMESGALLFARRRRAVTCKPPRSAPTSTSPCAGRPRAPASRRSSTTRPTWVEAVYVYPLPEDSAVDTLKMVIGDRVVVGDIKERRGGQGDLRAGQGQRPEGGRWSSRSGRTSSPTRSPISARAKPS